MDGFLFRLFDTGGFPPRWHCGVWSAEHGWLHIISDLGVFGAYTAIPCVLAFFVLRRGDLPFHRIFWLFCAFIFACGTTHLIEAIIFWQPIYRFAGFMKLVTALVSWTTVAALIYVTPAVLHLPGLAAVNARLEREIAEHKRTAEALRKTEESYRRRLERELEQRTAELERRNADLEEFAYVVAHDLKAPLRAITSLAGWINDDYGDRLDEDGREQLQLLAARSQRMHRLIEGILEYSRASQRKMNLDCVETAPLVEEVIQSLAPPPYVAVRVEGPLPAVVFDRTQLTQIFQNLIDNAIRHSDKPQGAVIVSCREREDAWEFRVQDNGPGIAEEHHTRIFKVFQTLRPRDEVESTGVGLSVVKRLVERRGGRVGVHSRPGHGSTFWFTAPKEIAPEETAAENEARAPDDQLSLHPLG